MAKPIKGTWAVLCALLAAALAAAPARCGFFPDNAFTDEARGLTGAQFLKVPPSARFSALGGAGLALRGPDAFFLNPAGAAALPARNRAVSASYEALLEGASRTGLVFSNSTASGVLSAGLLYHGASPGEQLDGAGTGSGSEVQAYDLAAGAGWARAFRAFDFGLNLKYVKSALAGESGATAALDAGFIFKDPSSNTELALAVRNFGPPLKLGSEKDPLPFELGGGLRWKYAPRFNIFMEGRLPSDHAPYLAFAGEYSIPYASASGLFLRGGMNFKNYDDHGFMGAFTGGFGLRFGGFALDYAFAPYGELGAAHRMTAGLAWGGAPSDAKKSSAAPAGRGALLAVGAFSAGSGVTETEASVVRNLAESELLKTGRYRLVERSKLDFILAEKKLAYAGLSEGEAASRLARLSGADLALLGNVSRNKSGYLITARIVDAASGEILVSGSAAAPEDYLFRDAARRLAAELSAH
ncbi:MAG: hypothetical protein A2049_04215 [Elusimicrobia bacterium GWA2_62_23]|nr:MAG: hypothetical protein A2049_04215 [Elusimicrobia bacterium GWA2_62_23]OGR67588.1 MAG: hypothetical protein A2179_07735 [Elusimicrobia bacterium GWC2_63_65]